MVMSPIPSFSKFEKMNCSASTLMAEITPAGSAGLASLMARAAALSPTNWLKR